MQQFFDAYHYEILTLSGVLFVVGVIYLASALGSYRKLKRLQVASKR